MTDDLLLYERVTEEGSDIVAISTCDVHSCYVISTCLWLTSVGQRLGDGNHLLIFPESAEERGTTILDARCIIAISKLD